MLSTRIVNFHPLEFNKNASYRAKIRTTVRGLLWYPSSKNGWMAFEWLIGPGKILQWRARAGGRIDRNEWGAQYVIRTVLNEVTEVGLYWSPLCVRLWRQRRTKYWICRHGVVGLIHSQNWVTERLLKCRILGGIHKWRPLWGGDGGWPIIVREAVWI